MIKWFKARTRQEKWMIAIIAALLIGVAVRWSFIKKEAGDAFRQRIEHFKKPAPAQDSIPSADSGGWNAIRDTAGL